MKNKQKKKEEKKHKGVRGIQGPIFIFIVKDWTFLLPFQLSLCRTIFLKVR